MPALTIYFRLLWGVPPFCIDYTEMRGHLAPFSLAVMTGAFVLALWAAATWAAWRDERYRLAAVGLLWLALFLLPVSNLVPMMQYVAERFLYLSLIGWLLALGGWLVWTPRRRASVGLAAALIAAWLPLSLAREGIWRDEVTLFVRSSQADPANKRLRENAVGRHFRPCADPFGLPAGGDDAPFAGGAFDLAPRGGRGLAGAEEAHQLLPDEHRITTALGISLGDGRPNLKRGPGAGIGGAAGDERRAVLD